MLVRVLDMKRELVLEKSPKWEALTEVLQEIERENKSSQHEPGQSSVLLKCYKGSSCQQCVSSLFSGFAYFVLYYQNVMETSFSFHGFVFREITLIFCRLLPSV